MKNILPFTIDVRKSHRKPQWHFAIRVWKLRFIHLLWSSGIFFCGQQHLMCQRAIRLVYPPSFMWTSKRLKIKVTLLQALRLCTGRTAHRGSRGIALLFYDHGTRRGEGSALRPDRSLPPRENPVPTVQEAGWAPGPVWTGAENLAPHRVSIPGPSSP